MSPAATALLERLRHVPRPLSAQHDYLTSGTRYRDAVGALTGRAPAIYGSDFSFLYAGDNPAAIGHCGPANLLEPGHAVIRWTNDPARIFAPECPPKPNPVPLETQRAALVDRCLRLHTEEGAIITLMWHTPPPGCGNTARDGDLWMKQPYPNEAGLKASVVTRATRVAVLADATRLERPAAIRFADRSVIDDLVSDKTPADRGARAALSRAGVALHVAKS